MKIELEEITAGANYWSVIFDSRPIGRFDVRDISITEKCETMQSGGTLVQYGHRKDLVIHGTCHPGLNGGLDSDEMNMIREAVRPILITDQHEEMGAEIKRLKGELEYAYRLCDALKKNQGK